MLSACRPTRSTERSPNDSRFFLRLKLWRTCTRAACPYPVQLPVGRTTAGENNQCRSDACMQRLNADAAAPQNRPAIPARTKIPSCPAITSSGIPVIAGASTIFPRAIASISTSGIPSLRLVSTTTSARSYRANSSASRATCPSKRDLLSQARAVESGDSRRLPLRPLACDRTFEVHPTRRQAQRRPAPEMRDPSPRAAAPRPECLNTSPAVRCCSPVRRQACISRTSTPSRATITFSAIDLGIVLAR